MNWWKTPRSAEEIIHERKVTHIELFYDIIFSFLFGKFISNFASNLSFTTFKEFILLVVLAFFGWFSGVNYMERHGHDDLRTRVFAILQMLAVGGMVIFSRDSFGENYIQFFIFYSALLSIQTYLDFVVRRLHSSTATFAARSMVEFVPLLLVLSSLFVSSSIRVYLLVLVCFIDIFGPELFSIRVTMFAKNVINDITVVTGSLISRFSRFVMIILGNSVGAILNGVNYSSFSSKNFLFLTVGVLIIIGVWWIYFDHIPEKKPKDTIRWRVFWINLHLLIVVAISGLAVGIIYFMKNLNNINFYRDAFLIINSSLILYYLSLTFLLEL